MFKDVNDPHNDITEGRILDFFELSPHKSKKFSGQPLSRFIQEVRISRETKSLFVASTYSPI